MDYSAAAVIALRPFFVWPSVVIFALTLAVARPASAQFGQTPSPRPSSSSSSSSSSSAPSLGTPWGTRTEHWLAAGIALALGAATVAVGTGIYRYALDVNAHALAPGTVQLDAASSSNTANDFLLVSEVLWSIGASLAAMGLTWVIVLSFSTPAPSATPEAPAAAPSATLRMTPLGVTLEGVF